MTREPVSGALQNSHVPVEEFVPCNQFDSVRNLVDAFASIGDASAPVLLSCYRHLVSEFEHSARNY